MAFKCFLLTSCSSTPRTSMPTPSSRVYHGTASVGDFLTITIDSGAQTIAYTDVSNNTSGTVPYTVNSDGTYALTDPTGNLVGAYEVPNYALLIQAAKTGPNSNTPALITAVESGQISLATFEGQSYNYMQFRTAAGGMEVGSVSVTSQGLGSISSFWPYGSYNQGNQGGPFNSGTIDMSRRSSIPPAPFSKFPSPTTNRGSIMFRYRQRNLRRRYSEWRDPRLEKGLQQKFSIPRWRGRTRPFTIRKTGRQHRSRQRGNRDRKFRQRHVSGHERRPGYGDGWKRQSDGAGYADPVADVSYLYGSAGQLTDPCYGVFTFRVTGATSQQDVFVTFMGQAMLFSSFTANLPWASGGTYNYFYGVALK